MEEEEKPKQCPSCGAKNRKITEHHIVPLSQGGLDIDGNKEWLCEICHKKIHGERTVKKLKQILVIRADLKMEVGEIASHVAHGSVKSAIQASKTAFNKWNQTDCNKAILQVKSEKELIKLYIKCLGEFPCYLVKGNRRIFEKPKFTCLAVGPTRSEKLDEIFGELELL